jgi:hypothetical protein
MAAATKAAVCGWLATGGNAVLGSMVVNGLRVPGAQVPSAAAGLGLLALNYGCNFNQSNTGPVDPNAYTGCKEASSGTLTIWRTVNGVRSSWYTNVKRVVSIGRIGTTDGGTPIWTYDFYLEGGVHIYQAQGASAGWTGCDGTINAGGVCANAATGMPPATGNLPPANVTTGANCQLTVNFDSWLVGGDGSVRPVVKISPAAGGLGARASGGIVGGCNFPPMTVVGGDGGGKPPWITPWQPTPTPDGGKPWWLSLLENAGDAALEWTIKNALDQLFGPKLPATIYRLTSACEVDADGEALDRSVEVQIPQLQIGPGLAARLDALAQLDQGLKDFRQPVCQAPATVGPVVNVRFESAVRTAAGDAPLRKEFRYRAPKGADMAAHRAHWKGFEWTSGPVMVISEGANWGKPRVWATSAEEGKRVLHHAAAVSGVDLSAAAGHRFVVREVLNPRYGQRLKMVLRKAPDGGPWVTDRSGPGGFPVVTG